VVDASALAVRDNRLLMKPRNWGTELERRGWPGEREYQLLVELSEIKPRIWRRLNVADTTPLPLLHRILQVAFGWQDYHLHEFKVGPVRFGIPDEDFPPPHIDERQIKLYQIGYEPGDRFLYTYDFGDSWHHEVLLEELRAAEEPRRPRCIEGQRASPPEDCGGVEGYERLVSALRDPNDPEHDDIQQWAGGWEPERLDLEMINSRLARLPYGRRAASTRSSRVT
jgi:hypothetical protein